MRAACEPENELAAKNFLLISFFLVLLNIVIITSKYL
nr:MAG TPA_asm: hypothetical protein [Caudoviricetes sp.]